MVDLKQTYLIDKSSEKRFENDHYPTPPIATYSFLKEFRSSAYFGRILEPCSGTGWMAKELFNNGHRVKAFDLYPYDRYLVDTHIGYDVFSHNPDDYDSLITNPPYRDDMPFKIAEWAVPRFNMVAMFLRINFLEGIKRYDFFKKYPPAFIYTMSNRHSHVFENDILENQFKGMMFYMWVVWDNRADRKYATIWHPILSKSYFEEWKKDSYPKYIYSEENPTIRYIGQAI